MTETMIDLPDVIAKSDDADFLRDLIQDAAQRLMYIEVAAICGATHGERSPDRANQRNGCWPRQWDTRGHDRPDEHPQTVCCYSTDSDLALPAPA